MTWMVHKEQANYESIKRFCEYLNKQYSLNEEHPAWAIFFPLFYAGNIDSIRSLYFRVTEPVVVHRKGIYVYTNVFDQPQDVVTPFPFIYSSKVMPELTENNVCEFNAISILNYFPTAAEIVNTFQLSLVERSSLLFVDRKSNQGVAYIKDSTPKHYCFVFPNSNKILDIPHWGNQPDVRNLAYCYYRSINENDNNGTYKLKDKVLSVKHFGFPIMLYRVLLLESLLEGYTPVKENDYYVFPGINASIVKQLNRILSNSIQNG